MEIINMNPKAPQILGTINLHKQEKPVRPIVNGKKLRDKNWQNI
jgi:hypothetical protein